MSSGESSETVPEQGNVVFIGSVDAGKSTLCGHLLALTGSLPAKHVAQVRAAAEAAGRCVPVGGRERARWMRAETAVSLVPGTPCGAACEAGGRPAEYGRG
jgi:adenylate kinase family enzyme